MQSGPSDGSLDSYGSSDSNISSARPIRRARTGAAIGAALALASALSGLPAGPARAQDVPAPLTLSWALETAARTNPAIAVEEASRDAARERVVTAGSLEDPRFAYEASNVPTGDHNWDFDSTPLSGHQLGLRQKLPFPGVLSNRRGAARAELAATDLELDDQRLRVAADVEQAWAELGYHQRALAITRRNIATLRQLSAVAEVRYGVGEGLQQDVIRAQVELTTLLQEELGRIASVEMAGARLAELLDLDPTVRFPETAPLAQEAIVPALDALVADLESRSPQLRAAAARVEEAERRVRVAELEGLPDFDLGIGYRIRRDVDGDPVHGADFVSAGVTVRLPVDRRKWRARVAEAHADLRHARAGYRRETANLLYRVRSAHAELVRSDAEARLLETGLLPQARQSLESSRAGYEVGRIDFLSLLDSQVSLLRAELREVRALANRRQAFAALEAAAGEGLR